MPRCTPTVRDVRRLRLLASGVLFVAAVGAWTDAQAQLCQAALPAANPAAAADVHQKFRLIHAACPELVPPGPAHRARQLELFDAARPVAITLPGDSAGAALAEPATGSAPALAFPPATGSGPPDRATTRVVSLAPALADAARANDLDPLLLHAIAHVESRHNAQAVSPAGARGVMQVMPATARRFGVADPERSLLDADTNLRASAALLRTLRARYGDDLRLVLAAYNAGEGAVARHGGDVPPYPETKAYVRDVLAVYRRLTTTFAVSPTGTLQRRDMQTRDTHTRESQS